MQISTKWRVGVNFIALLLLINLVGCEANTTSNAPSNNAADSAVAETASNKAENIDFGGHWYAQLQTPAGVLPFEIDLQSVGNGGYLGKLSDGNREVPLQNFQLVKDHLTFGISDDRIQFDITRKDRELVGSWKRTGNSGATALPFTATTALPAQENPAAASKFVGEWRCINKEEGKEIPILLMVKSDNGQISGTGIDPTGDFGAMRGQLRGEELVLSRFDGQSLSLVIAKLAGEKITAKVSTSPRSQFTIDGAREGTNLPDPATVAKVAGGLKFSFPDVQGTKLNYPSEKYAGKAVIINIMGTWCHNCQDETPFLVELYRKYQSEGLEVISLCFEAQATPDADLRAIDRFRRNQQITFPLLYAGKLEDGAPAKTITGLTNFGGYPTNIFIDRKGKIVATHTGFWGPATGEKHIAVKQEFEANIAKILAK
jgi:thiol-disulfide isomerase/thioredoxin